MKTYMFRQNNSGGVFIGPHEFFVQAESVDHAWLELEKQEWFTTCHCECCGERWSKWNCGVYSNDSSEIP